MHLSPIAAQRAMTCGPACVSPTTGSVPSSLSIVDAEQVSIIGVFYGGQDYETILQEDLTRARGTSALM